MNEKKKFSEKLKNSKKFAKEIKKCWRIWGSTQTSTIYLVSVTILLCL